MKYTYKTDNGHELKFLRTLDTEKKFRQTYNTELNAQLSVLVAHLTAAEQNPTDPEAIAGILDLNFSQTRHELLRAMFADERDDRLVQNDETAKKYDTLVESLELSERDIFQGLLFRILAA